jgi:hypothetical protein
MLWATAVWEYLKALPGLLEKITLDGLLDSVGDILTDPEILLPAIAVLLLLWALIAITKFWLSVIETLFSRDSGPRGLGLN